MDFSPFLICPHCGGALQREGGSLLCDGRTGRKHCYDIAAAGYVNLLPPGKGGNAHTGDDAGMIAAARSGVLCIEKLEAMTCVCSVGLDMIAIPGSTTASTISGIIADEAAIGMINQKTTAVRIIPVEGKDVGDTVEFGGLLGYAPVMPVNGYSCEAFIKRPGRIPAPIHSFKN